MLPFVLFDFEDFHLKYLMLMLPEIELDFNLLDFLFFTRFLCGSMNSHFVKMINGFIILQKIPFLTQLNYFIYIVIL